MMFQAKRNKTRPKKVEQGGDHDDGSAEKAKERRGRDEKERRKERVEREGS